MPSACHSCRRCFVVKCRTLSAISLDYLLASVAEAFSFFDHDTVLNKGEFVDAVYIRYGWTLPNLPTNCVRGASFDVQHALDCMIGGYRTSNTMKFET